MVFKAMGIPPTPQSLDAHYSLASVEYVQFAICTSPWATAAEATEFIACIRLQTLAGICPTQQSMPRSFSPRPPVNEALDSGTL